jgi:4-amino-4-deoxy-L-arabinose transferase-like glycosyltransferase
MENLLQYKTLSLAIRGKSGSSWRVVFFLCLVALFLFLNIRHIPFGGDERFYADAAYTMLESRQWNTPIYEGQMRWQKPILNYWFIMLSYKMFGVSMTSARIPAAFFGFASIVLAYLFGRVLFGKETEALVSAAVLFCHPTFLAFACRAQTDAPFMFFIFLALVGFYQSLEKGKPWILLAWASMGLAVLIKGWGGLLFPCPSQCAGFHRPPSHIAPLAEAVFTSQPSFSSWSSLLHGSLTTRTSTAFRISITS